MICGRASFDFAFSLFLSHLIQYGVPLVACREYVIELADGQVCLYRNIGLYDVPRRDITFFQYLPIFMAFRGFPRICLREFNKFISTMNIHYLVSCT